MHTGQLQCPTSEHTFPSTGYLDADSGTVPIRREFFEEINDAYINVRYESSHTRAGLSLRKAFATVLSVEYA